MAVFSTKLVLLLFVISTLLLVVHDVDGRRGGGGSRGSSSRGSSRSSTKSRGSSKTSTKSRVKDYSKVALSGRIVKGSSPFTGSSWRTAALAGAIFGGLMYTRRYPHVSKMPPICTNTDFRAPDGRAYKYFICPRETDPSDYHYCCGPEKREYCCNKTMAQKYYYDHHNRKGSGAPVAAIIGIVIVIIIVLVVGIYCCKKRKYTGQIMRKFSSKRDDRYDDNNGVPLQPHGLHPQHFGAASKREDDDIDPHSVPLNSPEKFRDAGPTRTPSQPPPAYSAATAGYDGACGTPYGPPQPQPEFADGKSGLPPPGIDAGAPYPTGAPYPPMGAPYPPADEAPYPPAGGAPYPPPSGAPYPPPSGAPYPPPSTNPTAPPYPGTTYPTGPGGSAAYDANPSCPPYPPPSSRA